MTPGNSTQNSTPTQYEVGDYVVYPTHGVGKITQFEHQKIAGMDVQLLVIEFEREKMVLRVPVMKARSAGLRKLSSSEDMNKVFSKLQTRVKAKKAMWTRRAQEYETKINSGDPVSIAEVMRELYRNPEEDQSYSERQMYQLALERLSRELAAVQKINEGQATHMLENILKEAA
jgi:CarD family transcriptional regulator